MMSGDPDQSKGFSQLPPQITSHTTGVHNEGQMTQSYHDSSIHITGQTQANNPSVDIGSQSSGPRTAGDTSSAFATPHSSQTFNTAAAIANHVTQNFLGTGPNIEGNQENAIVEPKDYSLPVRLREKITGKSLTNFVTKLKKFSWKNVQGKVTENYEDLSEPEKVLYPQVKTGFRLFKGDYLPQEGFSAHCQPKGGEYIDIEKCKEVIQEERDRPCMIIGQPGSGKTVLSKRFAKALMIANRLESPHQSGIWRKVSEILRKERRREFDIVFYMNIRDLPDVGTLAETIFCPSVTGLTAKEAKFGLEAILNKKIRTIMFFDGLDQASWEPKCEKKVSPWEKSSMGQIFGNILSGHLLTHVPIIITSREHSVALLSKEMRPQYMAALVGFSRADAKSLYCEIMGEGASKDWDMMQISNPAMHSMCLTPMFLIFYMITKKNFPDDPLDCATGVLVSVIQIFLECENTRRTDEPLLDKLKKLAFRGTKEKRVVFKVTDLQCFEIKYKDFSDIIIKVPGSMIVGQRILEGMCRYFFSHQTLQEILAALYVVELDRRSFESLVDEEFQNVHWSVVRSFVCGILKNEQVKKKIHDGLILAENTGALAEKCEHLMKHLQTQLSLSRSPAEKLETFVALKEANAIEILQGLAENLDFSNSSLTPTTICVLCSIIKYVGEVPCLSFANSGMNDKMLEVFAKETDGLFIKISKFDMRGNSKCQDYNIWRRVFSNMSVSFCFMDVPRDKQDKIDCDAISKILDAANRNVGHFNFGELSECRLSFLQLLELFKSEVQIQIRELYLQPDLPKFKIQDQMWKLLRGMSLIAADNCFIENPEPERGRVDVKAWLKAAEAVHTDNVKNISLISTENISLTIEDISLLNESKLHCKIFALFLQPDNQELDKMEETLSGMSLIFVDSCVIENPKPSEQGRVDGKAWLKAAEAIRTDNVKNISLIPTENISLTIEDIALLKNSKHHVKMENISEFDPLANQSDPLAQIQRQPESNRLPQPRNISVVDGDFSDLRGQREQMMQLYMARREEEYTDRRLFKIFAGTWNTNGQTPPRNVNDWLYTIDLRANPPDLYFIGFQELDLSKEALVFVESFKEEQWRKVVERSLPTDLVKYELLRCQRLVGMMLLVYVKTTHSLSVRNLSFHQVGTGLLGRIGNKGGVAVRFDLHHSSICVVNSQLASHVKESEHRNEDFHSICSKLRFSIDNQRPLSLFQHDIVFWLGDLNYRIQTLDTKVVKQAIDAGEYKMLREYDQLLIEKASGNAYLGFSEGELNFRPTYKYNPGTDDWDTSEKCRTPAWCDRILWWEASLHSASTKQKPIQSVSIEEYQQHMALTISDHKPVSAQFNVKIKVINAEKYQRVFEEENRRLDKLENEQLPTLTLSAGQIDFGNVKFQEAKLQSLEIVNTGMIPCKFEFISRPGTPNFCQKWLTITSPKGSLFPGETCLLEFEVYVNRITAPLLNSGKERLDDILCLHLVGGKDFFIVVSGKYVPSCFGMSIEALCRLQKPIATVTAKEIEELSAIPATLIDLHGDGEAQAVPKELWTLIDHLYRNGMKQEDLFQEPGLHSEVEEIRDWLDSTIDIRDGSNKLPGSNHSAAEALLILLEAIPEPVVTFDLYEDCLFASASFHDSKQVLLRLSQHHRNVFQYLMSFLRELLRYSEYNGLDIDFLANAFSGLLLRPRSKKPMAERRIDRERAKTFICHFLTNRYDG